MLDKIIQTRRQEVESAKASLPFETLQARVEHRLPTRSLREALTASDTLALIAELKRKSPSKGMLRERFDPVSLAQQLQEAGAAALSVLTDETHFGGHLDFLRDARQFTELPVLRKDFIVDPYQVYEAAWYEADAVLLIVRVLSPALLRACLQAARQLSVEPVVEVHAAEELQAALDAGAEVIGINHRDLDTFQMNPDLSEQLVPKVPKGTVVIAESGIQSAADVQRMAQLGVQGVLIGEALMTASNPSAKVRELFAGTW